MYEFKLKKGILIHDLKLGDYVEEKTIKVVYKGVEGMLILSKIQSIILKKINDITMSRGGNEVEKMKKEANARIQPSIAERKKEMQNIIKYIYFTGDVQDIETIILKSLETFATIRNDYLSRNFQEQIEIEDLENLIKGVLDHFLVPKLTRTVNSMSNNV